MPSVAPIGIDSSRVIFIGLGSTAVAWYRCYLPAMFLGADWVGLVGEPPEWRFTTGLVKRETRMPETFDDYDVVVLQQPRGRRWLRIIRRLQEQGKKVIFEVDDYLHAIRKVQSHDYRRGFAKSDLAELELNMRVCDALICSTPYIARRYAAFNRNVFVCRNGLDLGRYRVTRPKRDQVNIGWAGATGHAEAIAPWLGAVDALMTRHANVGFVSIGEDYASALRPTFGERRCVSVPFTFIETYPAAMCSFDIALGPAGTNNFYRGKSDLRWLEAGALGVPIVASPLVYPDIEHGVTGFLAESPAQVIEHLELLVSDEKLRLQVGENARRYVQAERDMRVVVDDWIRAIAEVLG